jgi:hypothetical protein
MGPGRGRCFFGTHGRVSGDERGDKRGDERLWWLLDSSIGSYLTKLETPFQAPKANALCERLIGTMKRECLEHFFILYQYQLKRIVTQFADYYNQHRAHEGIDQRIPDQFNEPRPSLSNQVKGKVMVTPVLNVGRFFSRWQGGQSTNASRMKMAARWIDS